MTPGAASSERDESPVVIHEHWVLVRASLSSSPVPISRTSAILGPVPSPVPSLRCLASPPHPHTHTPTGPQLPACLPHTYGTWKQGCFLSVGWKQLAMAVLTACRTTTTTAMPVMGWEEHSLLLLALLGSALRCPCIAIRTYMDIPLCRTYMGRHPL